LASYWPNSRIMQQSVCICDLGILSPERIAFMRIVGRVALARPESVRWCQTAGNAHESILRMKKEIAIAERVKTRLVARHPRQMEHDREATGNSSGPNDNVARNEFSTSLPVPRIRFQVNRTESQVAVLCRLCDEWTGRPDSASRRCRKRTVGWARQGQLQATAKRGVAEPKGRSTRRPSETEDRRSDQAVSISFSVPAREWQAWREWQAPPAWPGQPGETRRPPELVAWHWLSPGLSFPDC